MAFSLIAVACPVVDPGKPTPAPPTPSNDSTTVSISATRKITATDLVGETLSGLVSLSGDGSYVVSFSGEALELPFEGLKNYDGARPFRKYCNYPISYNFKLGNKPSLPSGAGYGEIDLMPVLPSSVNLGSRSKGTTLYAPALPDGLTSVEAITLDENSRIRVTLSLVSTPFSGGTVTPSFSVDMRQFFESSDAVDGILNFDAPLTKENGWSYTKVFRLSGAVFDPANYDAAARNLKIDARIGLSGEVAYEGMKTTRATLSGADETMLLNVTVVLLDVRCESVTGSFDYKIKEQSTTLDLHELTTAGGKSLDLSNAQIRLDAAGEVPVAGFVTASLTTKRNRRTLGKADGLELALPAADDGKSSSVSRLLTASDSGIAALLEETPDELLLSSSVRTDPESVGKMWVGKGYAASVTPSVQIPLAFNKSFTAEVSDTLTVPAQLKTALKKGTATLSGEVVNSLPLAATMSVKMIAADGTVLTAETSMEVPAGATVPVSMNIRNAAGDGIDRLSNTVVTFRLSGTDTATSRPLKPTDAIQAELKIKFANE